jgi:hypothetical protein
MKYGRYHHIFLDYQISLMGSLAVKRAGKIGGFSLPDKHVNIGVGVKHRVIRQKKMNPAAGLHNVQTRHQTFAELLLTDINRLSHTIGERPHCNLLNLLENIVRVSVLEAMRAQKQQM